MSEDDSFYDLMGRLRDGDPEAAMRVFRRFARRLISLAAAHLDARMRQPASATWPPRCRPPRTARRV